MNPIKKLAKKQISDAELKDILEHAKTILYFAIVTRAPKSLLNTYANYKSSFKPLHLVVFSQNFKFKYDLPKLPSWVAFEAINAIRPELKKLENDYLKAFEEYNKKLKEAELKIKSSKRERKI